MKVQAYKIGKKRKIDEHMKAHEKRK